MIASDSTISLRDLDYTDWKTYRFNQIAFSISERVEPQQTDLDIYIGLEHIDAESLHIKRWGTPSDVEGTKLRVYPGDVIFGKRRAYQRKAAIAEFNGICSAHAMVLRANTSVIEPRLFPFFLHSDLFMHRAIDISVGSLSPTINWGTLKDQEFLLPPLDQQAQLAELLWAADEVVERYVELENSTKTWQDIYRNQLVIGAQTTNLERWQTLTINEICSKVTDGEHLSPICLPVGFPILSAKDIKEDEIALEDAKYISLEAFELSLKRCNPEFNDTLIVSRGATIGRTTLNTLRTPFALMGSVILLKPNKEVIIGEYLVQLIRRKEFQSTLLGLSGSSAQQAIYLQDLKKCKLLIPPLLEQKQIVECLSKIEIRRKEIQKLRLSAIALKNVLINQIFSF